MHRAAISPDPLRIDPDDIHDEYRRRGCADLTDEQLFELAARAISVPKDAPADSFILHAPLELLARRSLLRAVAPARREAVRERMLWIAATYERAGEPVAAPTAGVYAYDSPAAARAAIVSAIEAQDLESLDAGVSWLAQHGAADDVMALSGPMLASLAAAGHAAIYFFHLSRTAAHSRAALTLLRPLAREVARYPQLRIEWLDAGVEGHATDAAQFATALARTPRLGLPGSDFVFPTVHQVDSGGHARAIVGAHLPADFGAARAAILRVAAHSMVQDDPAYAPYGWTHCLTLPQAVLGISPWLPDTTTAAATAATYVVAFRAAEGAHEIDATWEPARADTRLGDALASDPQTAASAAYHATDAELDELGPEHAARAGAHEDAHLAKYTLACFDAAYVDPARRRLYLAAAASLSAWWKASG
jgi:hypothetical protein